EVAGLRGQYREPSMEAEPIRAKPLWRRVEDPVSHCLDGESLLLTGFPGTGKTNLAKKIVEALREHGDTVHIITKTHAAVQNVGLGAQTADHWVRRNVRSGHCNATWLVIEELTQLDTPLWADIACLCMNKKIRLLLLGDFRQLPVPLPEAAREARQRLPRRGEPDVSLVISHAKWLQINERENRRLAPADALVVQYEARGAVPTNAPQTMRVWPGLRLIGAGGEVQKGTFLTVKWRAASPSRGLTLRGRVWLYDVEGPHFTLKHLYMGCSRATNSELLSDAKPGETRDQTGRHPEWNRERPGIKPGDTRNGTGHTRDGTGRHPGWNRAQTLSLMKEFPRVEVLRQETKRLSVSCVVRRSTKLLGAFVTFRDTASLLGECSNFEHPGDGDQFSANSLESQMQLGSLQYPRYPMASDAEHFHFMDILAGTYDTSIKNVRISDNQWNNNQFLCAFPVERC
ncbi:pfh1, partial [Symbiodinium necroappetens]